MINWLLKWRRERYVYRWYASRVRAGFSEEQISILAPTYGVTKEELRTARRTWFTGRKR